MLNLLVPDQVAHADTVPPGTGTWLCKLSGTTMGTGWSVTCHTPPALEASLIRHRLEAGFTRIIAEMSTWDPTSLISRFNRLPVGSSLDLPETFRDVMDIALRTARATHGAFNPCLGADVTRRGFGPQGPAMPDTGTHATAWQGLRLDGLTLTRHADFQLDLSAVAKGYAVDCMAACLRDLGITSLLAEIGGEYVAGNVKPDGLPWWVDIESPGGKPGWRVALCGHSLATSGDYRKVRIENGRRISHIISSDGAVPEDGDLASVTVLHAACGEADAWATGLFTSGATDGLRLADAHGLAALFQFRDRPARTSLTMNRMLA